MNTECSRIDSYLQEELKPMLVLIQQRIQRTLRGPVTPNAETSFGIRKVRRFRDLESLAVLSWYIPEDFGVLLRLDLESKSYSSRKEKIQMNLLLTSKETMLTWLRQSRTDRSFFGNDVPRIKKLAQNLQFLTKFPRKPKKRIRRRGYRDHGSCRPESKWIESHDYSFTEEQNRIELQRSSLNATLSSLQQFGLLGVRLPELERMAP